jgi:hypothetical protein
MKKILIIILVLCLSNKAFSQSLLGQPGPSDCNNQWSFDLGYSHNNIHILDDDSNATTFISDNVFYRLNYDLTDRTELFAQIGLLNGRLNEIKSFVNNLNGYSAGVGFKQVLYDFEDGWQIGIVDNLFYTRAHQNEPRQWRLNFDLLDNKLLLGLSKKFGDIKIFGGPFWHETNGDGHVSDSFPVSTSVSDDLHEDEKFGLYLGTLFELPIETLSTSAKSLADLYRIQFEIQYIDNGYIGGISLNIPFK